MSEHLTHIAFYEDCARLLLASDAFTEAFGESLRKSWDVGLFTSGARGNHLHAVPLLEKYRTEWTSRGSGGEVEARVAAAIGWIAHRAVDFQMKPLSRALDREVAVIPNPLGLSGREHQVYQDAVTFREIYDGGRIQPGSPNEHFSSATLEEGMQSHPGASVVDVGQVEPLFAAQVQGDLLRLQAFTERESDDLGAWLDLFFEQRQIFSEDLRMYVEAYQKPDDEKMVRYIDQINWYNAGDDVIQWARHLQRGTTRPVVTVQEAVDMARTQSQYAQALHRGYYWLRAASDFFDGQMEKSDLYDTLEIWPADHRR